MPITPLMPATVDPPAGWPSWLAAPTKEDVAGGDALFALLTGDGNGAKSSERVPLEQLLELVRAVATSVVATDEEETLSREALGAVAHALRCVMRAPTDEVPLPTELADAAKRVRLAPKQPVKPAAGGNAAMTLALAEDAAYATKEAVGAAAAEAAAKTQKLAAMFSPAITTPDTAAPTLTRKWRSSVGSALMPPTDANRQRYAQIFTVLHTSRELKGPPREKSFAVLKKSGLPIETLEQIWALADVDGDGVLDPEEFILAMHLCNAKVKLKIELPEQLPPNLLPASKAGAL